MMKSTRKTSRVCSNAFLHTFEVLMRTNARFALLLQSWSACGTTSLTTKPGLT